jgi:hypothetical protein
MWFEVDPEALMRMHQTLPRLRSELEQAHAEITRLQASIAEGADVPARGSEIQTGARTIASP